MPIYTSGLRYNAKISGAIYGAALHYLVMGNFFISSLSIDPFCLNMNNDF